MPLPHKTILIIAVAIVGLLLLSVGSAVWSLGAKNPADQTPKLLTVKDGDSVASVAQQLSTKQLIRSEMAFKLLARAGGSDVKIGLYHVSPSQSPLAILRVLSEGKANEVSVTFPEGIRLEEVAKRLVNAKLVSSSADFKAAAVVTDTSPDWLKNDYGLGIGSSLEGFLFPDTYRFAAQSTPRQIVDKLLQNFRKQTSDLGLNYDHVKLASIVEREALFDEDRPAIAGVYANRLEIGMKLDADPTVQYAKSSIGYKNACHPELVSGSDSSACAKFDFWPKITTTDYQSVNSPYNTYRNPGLPPTPISNPGLTSLKAAADPATNDFFYFLHDSQGHTHFARDAAQHSRNKVEFLQ